MIITLTIGLIFVIVVPAFAVPLNAFQLLGFPLGTYMAAQGSVLVLLALVFLFARRQDAIDRAHDVAEPD